MKTELSLIENYECLWMAINSIGLLNSFVQFSSRSSSGELCPMGKEESQKEPQF